MKETIEGIILNETNYGETSKILNILTKEHGYISVIAKGSRTLKSKLRGVSMKLIYANFTITYKESGISNLIEATPINSLKNILTDLKKMNYATYLLDITKSLLKETSDKEIYEIVKNTLLKINDNFDPEILLNIVEIKYLKYLGVKPNFSKCFNCNSKDILTYDLKLGGVVCNKCYQDGYVFSINTMKLLKLFQEIDIRKIDKLKITSQKTKEELNLFIQEYYETYTGIYLKKKEKLKLFI